MQCTMAEQLNNAEPHLWGQGVGGVGDREPSFAITEASLAQTTARCVELAVMILSCTDSKRTAFFK